MTVILVLLGLIAFVAMVASLIRAVVTDGYGTRPTPHSHLEEVGAWITQQHTR